MIEQEPDVGHPAAGDRRDPRGELLPGLWLAAGRPGQLGRDHLGVVERGTM